MALHKLTMALDVKSKPYTAISRGCVGIPMLCSSLMLLGCFRNPRIHEANQKHNVR